MKYTLHTCPVQPLDVFDGVSIGDKTQTILQFRAEDGSSPSIVEWGVSFDGPAGASVRCELVETDEPATVQPFSDAEVVRLDDYAMRARDLGSRFDLSPEGSGHTAQSEGEVTDIRRFDAQFVRSDGQYTRTFPATGTRLTSGKTLRIRVKADRPLKAFAFLTLDF